MKPSLKDFDKFKKSCKKWQYKLGLTNYDISYEFKGLKDSQAECEADLAARSCVISLSSKELDDSTDLLAFHEMCELMMYEISSNIDRYYSAEESQRLVHDIIVRLENLIIRKLS